MAIKFCFIGYGSIAQYHARILAEAGASLHTVVGHVPESTAKFAAEFGFMNHTTDLKSALTHEDIDAVVVASPSQLHYEQTRQALIAGKHVLVEVPLAIGYQKACELVDLSQQHNRCLMVAQSHRFFPSLAKLKERISANDLHVYHLIGRSVFLRRVDTGWTGRQRSWQDSLVWHHGCHLVDLSLWLLGADQVNITGYLAKPDPRTGIPMDLDVLIRTPADQLISLSLSFNSHINQFEEYLIIGEEESLRFEEGRLYGADGLVDDPAIRGENYYELAWMHQDREFLAAVQDGRSPAVSGADTLPALYILQEIEDRFSADLLDYPTQP